MTEAEIVELLRGSGAVVTGSHVVYTSGRHGASYINKDAIYPHTREISRLGLALAQRFAERDVEAVIAPAVGGIVLSQWVAHHLTQKTGRDVLAVYAEKLADATGGFVIKRGYDALIRDKRVLVVEDVVTTGGSAKRVIEATRAVGATVVGLGVLCNRGGVTAQELGDVPELVALVKVDFTAWDEANCPLCRHHVPVNLDVGKGREYVARQQAAARHLVDGGAP
jgi:orotate phosphoribosyltransferase